MKYNVTVNGKLYEVEVEQAKKGYSSVSRSVEKEVKPEAPAAQPIQKKAEAKSSGKGSAIVCPMPGSVVDVLVKEGASVKAGETVLILEAMKMESEIKTEVSGVVKEIKVKKGEHVESSDVLIVVA